MIDLERFTKKKEVIVPIVEGWGQYEGRKIYFPKAEDGYYKATLGHSISLGQKASLLEVFKAFKNNKKYRVYAIGEEGVVANFDTFLRNGWGETIKINFINVRLFETVEVVLWEDGRFYFHETILPKNKKTIQEIKESFESEASISKIVGVTPELRYYFLLASLQRQSVRAAEEMEKFQLSEIERKKRVEEFNATFPGRLRDTVEKAGGKLVRYSKHGRGYLVEWRIGRQLVKSTIRDDMRIINAGFCLSNDDKRHSVSSIVQLAKLFQKDAPLYITRE